MVPRALVTTADAPVEAAHQQVGSDEVVSVLLPTKNGGPLLDRVMQQIFAQKTTFAFEVIAVDSGSTDETLEILSRYDVRLYQIPPHEFNHGGTRNLLARLSLGDYLVFISQDAVPNNENWLQNLVHPLMTNGVVGAYARQVPRPDTDPINAFFLGEMYPKQSRTQYLNGKGLSLDTVRFSDASSAMKRAVWEAVPFRSDIIMAEDQDWSVRVLTRGHKLAYVAEAEVEHAHHYTYSETFKKYFDSGVSYREIFEMGNAKNQFGSDFLSNGLGHVWRKVAHLWNGGHKRWIPQAIAMSAVKAVAVIMGKHHNLLPTWLKVRCSWHKYHWKIRPTGKNAARREAHGILDADSPHVP